MTTSVAADWRDDVEGVEPTVLVLGGFLTSPPIYRRFVGRLLERGAAHVVVGGVWTPDWVLANWRGLGPILTRSARALLRAGEVAATSRRSRGAPVLVVGHSAGGMSARLLTAREPFAGRRLGGAERMGAIVTLGTPHVVSPERGIGQQVAWHAAAFADRHVPGAAFAPRVGYLTVASRAIVGRPDGDGEARSAWRLYRSILSEPDAAEIAGDGLVPVRSAVLAGAPSLVLDRAVHGQVAGRPWYGAEPEIDRWWPLAVAAWRDALRARVDDAPSVRSRGRVGAV